MSTIKSSSLAVLQSCSLPVFQPSQGVDGGGFFFTFSFFNHPRRKACFPTRFSLSSALSSLRLRLFVRTPLLASFPLLTIQSSSISDIYSQLKFPFHPFSTSHPFPFQSSPCLFRRRLWHRRGICPWVPSAPSMISLLVRLMTTSARGFRSCSSRRHETQDFLISHLACCIHRESCTSRTLQHDGPLVQHRPVPVAMAMTVAMALACQSDAENPASLALAPSQSGLMPNKVGKEVPNRQLRAFRGKK